MPGTRPIGATLAAPARPHAGYAAGPGYAGVLCRGHRRGRSRVCGRSGLRRGHRLCLCGTATPGVPARPIPGMRAHPGYAGGTGDTHSSGYGVGPRYAVDRGYQAAPAYAPDPSSPVVPAYAPESRDPVAPARPVAARGVPARRFRLPRRSRVCGGPWLPGGSGLSDEPGLCATPGAVRWPPPSRRPRCTSRFRCTSLSRPRPPTRCPRPPHRRQQYSPPPMTLPALLRLRLLLCLRLLLRPCRAPRLFRAPHLCRARCPRRARRPGRARHLGPPRRPRRSCPRGMHRRRRHPCRRLQAAPVQAPGVPERQVLARKPSPVVLKAMPRPHHPRRPSSAGGGSFRGGRRNCAVSGPGWPSCFPAARPGRTSSRSPSS